MGAHTHNHVLSSDITKLYIHIYGSSDDDAQKTVFQLFLGTATPFFTPAKFYTQRDIYIYPLKLSFFLLLVNFDYISQTQKVIQFKEKEKEKSGYIPWHLL